MNAAERIILFAISDSNGPTFADLSLRLGMSTPGLEHTLHNLARRNFVAENDGRYTLRPGVKVALQSRALNE